MRVSRFLTLFQIFVMAFTLSVATPAPKAAAACGVGCTYSIAQNVIGGAITTLINFIQNTFFNFLGNLQDQMMGFITGQFDVMRGQDTTERRAIADSNMAAGTAVVNGLEALNSNQRMGLRQDHQASIVRDAQGGVETVCPAMSRMQNMAASSIASDETAIIIESELANLNTNAQGYFGSASPLDFDSNVVRQSMPFMNPDSYNGGAQLLAMSRDDELHKKASFKLPKTNGGDENIQTVSTGGVGSAGAEYVNMDVRPTALLKQMAIGAGSEMQQAFQLLNNHIGGGPTSPLSAANLENASAATIQAISQSRALTAQQAVGLMPFIHALSDRLVSSQTSPAEAVPVLTQMMDELSFPDALKARYMQQDRFSYASMRDLVAYFPVFNPQEFASVALWGSNNAIRRQLLYQGFNVAYTIDLVKKTEQTNMLLGALLLHQLNQQARPVVEGMTGNQNIQAISDTPTIDMDEREMKHFINAAIHGTEQAIGADLIQ